MVGPLPDVTGPGVGNCPVVVVELQAAPPSASISAAVKPSSRIRFFVRGAKARRSVPPSIEAPVGLLRRPAGADLAGGLVRHAEPRWNLPSQAAGVQQKDNERLIGGERDRVEVAAVVGFA